MSLLIVSDLHVKGPDDPLYQSLLTLLRARSASGDTVVLAGDIFELFVGSSPVFLKRFYEFIQAIVEADRKGVKIHYIEGNHDFLLKRVFKKIPRLVLHPHDVSLEIDGKRIYVAHGDTVDKSDWGYLVLRFFFRSLAMRVLVRLIPGNWLDRIGQVSSEKSRKYKPLLVSDLPLTRMESLRRIYRSFAAEKLAEGYDFVVLGHCHDLDEMSFNIGNRKGQYINVGYPRAHGSFLSWTLGESKIYREKLPALAHRDRL